MGPHHKEVTIFVPLVLFQRNILQFLAYNRCLFVHGRLVEQQQEFLVLLFYRTNKKIMKQLKFAQT